MPPAVRGRQERRAEQGNRCGSCRKRDRVEIENGPAIVSISSCTEAGLRPRRPFARSEAVGSQAIGRQATTVGVQNAASTNFARQRSVTMTYKAMRGGNTFKTVESIGRTLPGVELTTTW